MSSMLVVRILMVVMVMVMLMLMLVVWFPHAERGQRDEVVLETPHLSRGTERVERTTTEMCHAFLHI